MAALAQAASVSPPTLLRLCNQTQSCSSSSFGKNLVFLRPQFVWTKCGAASFANGNGYRRGCKNRVLTETAEACAAGLKASLEDRSKREFDLSSSELPPSTETNGLFSNRSSTFLLAETEEDLLQGIEKEVESRRIPPRAGEGMKELYLNYRDAVFQSGAENAREVVVRVMATVLDRILLQFEDPFTFQSYHEAMRDPYDYYKFGQEYVRPLLDMRTSYFGNHAKAEEIEQFLKKGHNVVMLSNHQTEADPAVIALLLEKTHPYVAENITYIAGDRVVLDPFCKPFSMGRNLICVYSKKHINDEPELTEMKRRANTRSLKELTVLLRNGGRLIWIAPSGGRDRPDPDTNEWNPAPFDPASVLSITRLASHSKVPSHVYPVALLCHDIMPPPQEVEKDIGERRRVGYHGVGFSIGSPLDFKTVTSGITDSNEVSEVFSRTAWKSVKEQYDALRRAVYGGEGLHAASSLTSLSQPWICTPS